MIPANASFWNEKCEQPMCEEDARMAGENLISFFELLMEWKAKEDARVANNKLVG